MTRPIDAAEFAIKLADELDRLRETATIAGVVVATLAGYDGKKVTRRVESAVRVALPGYSVHYSAENGFFRLYVWSGAQTSRVQYNGRLVFTLAYTSVTTQRDSTYRHAERAAEMFGFSRYAATIAKGESLLADLAEPVARLNAAELARAAARAPFDAFAYLLPQN